MRKGAMNIVMLTEYFHPHIGGVEKHVRNLSGELALRGHSVTILTRRYDPALEKEERIGDLRVLRFHERPSLPFMKGSLWPALLSEVNLLKQADVIHVHDHTIFLKGMLPFRLLFPWKPFYVTFHGHEGRFPLARRQIVERRLVERLARGNICVGHYLDKWYGTRSSTVTYGAVSEPSDIPAPEERSIVFLGRLEPDTGIMTFLQAFSLIQEASQDPFRLYVCGEGSLMGKVRAFASEKAPGIEVLGRVDNPASWIARGRFVFASGYLSMLEAMISRRLVFAVYDNPLKQDYWMMMPQARDRMEIAHTPEGLAESFCALLKDPGRERDMTERSHAFARRHSWEELADLCLRLYS